MKNKLIFCSFLILISLIGFRIAYSQKMHFIFLIWNTFLAIVPYAISAYSKKNVERLLPHIALGSLCILFLPNALYLISDFEHLIERPSVPLFFDILILFYAAFLGLFLNVLSLRNLRDIFILHAPKKLANYFITLLILMSGFGVYLGRYLRWNSWDIFTQPIALAKCCLERFLEPHHYTYTWAVSIGYAFILATAYLLINQSTQLIKKEINNEK